MKLLFYSLHTEKQTTSRLSQTSFPNVILERHSQDLPNQYKEYMSEFWYTAKALKNSKVWFSTPTGGILGEVGVTTFRNVIGENYLSHSSEYTKPPSIETVRQWFPTIGYGEAIEAKGTLKKSLLSPREKVVPYPRFLSLLIEHKMEGYGNDEVTLNLTQIFSVHNWALKANQPEGSPFTDHIKKKSSSAKDSNLSQPLAFTLVVAGLHKEDQQATGGPTSLGVTSKEGAYPQLSSVVSTSLSKPVYLASTILHSKSTSGHDASVTSTTKADPGKTNPNDLVSQQQGIVKGNKTISFDHIFAGTDPHVFVDKTKSASEWLETIYTKPSTEKGANSIENEIEYAEGEFNTSPDLSSSDETKTEIKLEDLTKLVLNLEVDFMDLNSPKDDQPINVEEEEEQDFHAKKTLNSKLVKEKDAVETKAALFKAKLSFLNVEQLTEILVKSLKHELSKLLSSHDFSSSLPTKLKELPSKFSELTREIKELKKHVHELEIELHGNLKEIPTKLEKFSSTISSLTTQVFELKTLQWELPAEFCVVPRQMSSVQAKIKTLDALPSLLTKVTEALDRFAQVVEQASQKASGQGVPLVG
ncbi:hypothetical protein Tco_0375090 [Tanacetum coccineum]